MQLDFSAVPRPRGGKHPKHRLQYSPGAPQVRGLVARCPWAVLYDEEGRMYGWLPRGHPLQAQVAEQRECMDWALEDMEQTAAALAWDVQMRSDDAEDDSWLKKEEGGGGATTVSAPVPPPRQPRRQRAPVLPSGHHLLWVWLASDLEGEAPRGTGVQGRNRLYEQDVSRHLLDYPEPDRTYALYHWESERPVATLRLEYFAERVHPRAKRRVAVMVASLQWHQVPPPPEGRSGSTLQEEEEEEEGEGETRSILVPKRGSPVKRSSPTIGSPLRVKREKTEVK